MPEPDAEVTLTVEDVDRLITAQHPRLRAPLRPVAHGWDNEVFRLGNDLTVRLPRRAAAAQLIEHEQRWLPELAPRLPVPVPAPVAVGMPQGAYPWRWSITRWFEGERVADIPVGGRETLADDVAEVLRALHIPAPADAPHNPVRGVPLAARDAITRPRLVSHPGLLRAWNAALAAAPWNGAPVWVHGDLHPANLLARDGRLTAVIDFGDMCGGDPACDLALAWTGLAHEGRERLRRSLRDRYDDATWTRARGWAAAFAAILHDVDDPAMRALSTHTVSQLAD